MSLTRLEHQGNTLTTAYATLQTATSGLVALGYMVRKLSIVNVISVTSTSVTLRDVEVHLVADSSTPVALNRIWSGGLCAGASVLADGPWWASTGATVQARVATSGSTAEVAVRVSAFQEV